MAFMTNVDARSDGSNTQPPRGPSVPKLLNAAAPKGKSPKKNGSPNKEKYAPTSFDNSWTTTSLYPTEYSETAAAPVKSSTLHDALNDDIFRLIANQPKLLHPMLAQVLDSQPSPRPGKYYPAAGADTPLPGVVVSMVQKKELSEVENVNTRVKHLKESDYVFNIPSPLSIVHVEHVHKEVPSSFSPAPPPSSSRLGGLNFTNTPDTPVIAPFAPLSAFSKVTGNPRPAISYDTSHIRQRSWDLLKKEKKHVRQKSKEKIEILPVLFDHLPSGFDIASQLKIIFLISMYA